jgi:protein gp37
MGETSIEWTDKVWNPVTGCTKVSQGCKNCYAERIFQRPYPGRDFTDVRMHPDRLDAPLHWRKPSRIFVNSMSDLFHEAVPFEFIERIYATMADANWHTFQILTKRPERMLEFTKWQAGQDHISTAEWPRNVWLGVSCEDQESFAERLPFLTAVPAVIRFISFEPLLGPIDTGIMIQPHGWEATANALARIGWAIVGGESGPGARPMHLDWASSIVRQCQRAAVPVFVKQLGAVPIESEEVWRGRAVMRILSTRNRNRVPEGFVPLAYLDNKGGDINEFPAELRVRQYPEVLA